MTADDSVVGGTTYTNDVKVVSTSMPVGDPQGTERTYTTGSTSDVEVVQPPLTKSFDPKVATVGQSSKATVTFTVPSGTSYFDSTAIDDLPDGMSFESFDGCTGDAGLCGAVTNLGPLANTPSTGKTRIAWFFGDVASSPTDRTVTLTYTVVVGDTYANGSKVKAGDALTNSVAAYWNATNKVTTPPTNPPAPNSFDEKTPQTTDTITVVEPNLSIDKGVTGQSGGTNPVTADVNDTLTYTVTATNGTGTYMSAAYDVTITDVVPAGLVPDLASIATSGGSYNAGTRTITWTVAGPVAPSAAITFTYQATLGDSAAFDSITQLVNEPLVLRRTRRRTQRPRR